MHAVLSQHPTKTKKKEERKIGEDGEERTSERVILKPKANPGVPAVPSCVVLFAPDPPLL